MQRLFIDFVGKLPRSKAGNTVIKVCVDALGKLVWLIPLWDATTRSALKALKEMVFSNFSVPETLVSYNARCFMSREFRHFCFEMGVTQVTTAPYYPQPTHAERFNKNLRAALIAYHREAHDLWDSQLMWLQLFFNTAEHEDTEVAPFGVMFPFRSGSALRNLWKVNDLLPEKWSKAQLQRRLKKVSQNLRKFWIIEKLGTITLGSRYHSRRGTGFTTKTTPISKASQKIAGKLMLRYRGPFEIARFLTPVTVSLVDPDTKRFVTRYHVSLLNQGTVCQG